MGDHVKVTLNDGILTLAFNRAEKKNALTRAMYDDAVAAFDQMASDKSARVMVLTGSGDSFTSGNDIMDFMQHPPKGRDNPVGRFLERISTAEKPIVAAVNGLAVGVGVTMLLHCDLVYAARSAYLQMPFVNLALVPEAGSSKILPEMMGHRKAAELLMLGERFSAEEACSYGIANAAVEDGDLMKIAMEKAEQLAAKPPEALRLTKRLMKTHGRNIADAILEEGEIFQTRLTSPETIEAFTAFMERRAPDFKKFD